MPTMAGATTRVGNSEIQLVYEMQQAMQFKGDPTNNAEWVQWRNEMRLEYQYEDLVEDNKIFGQYTIPFIRKADFSLMYRGRVDPVYIVRDKYRELYNDNQTDHFLFPENDIREINLDTDFGEVFGHKLSMRLGKQQIVWGESNLFRSIDIVNPLRIDQNGFVGEAFEDFRTPIWAVKFLYDIGNVGTIASNVGVELFYTPRWRPGSNHLILEGGWDLQYRDPRIYKDAPDGINFIPQLGNNKKYGRVRNSMAQAQENGEFQDENGNPCPTGVTTCPGARAIRGKSKSGTAVWRSMIGFDLLRTWSFLPGTFGKDQWFLTGQHLLTYQNNNRPSALNAFTNAPFDRHQRWEQLFTLSGSGFFAKGKFEPLWAYAYSANAKQHLILAQFFWHGLYFKNLDLFAGTALYLGSRFQTNASFLNYYADRDTAWIRLQYFIL